MKLLVAGFVELFEAALLIGFVHPEVDSLEQRPFGLHHLLDCAAT